jgi:hypothetical protein
MKNRIALQALASSLTVSFFVVAWFQVFAYHFAEFQPTLIKFLIWYVFISAQVFLLFALEGYGDEHEKCLSDGCDIGARTHNFSSKYCDKHYLELFK